jgi:hypothetical protein
MVIIIEREHCPVLVLSEHRAKGWSQPGTGLPPTVRDDAA